MAETLTTKQKKEISQASKELEKEGVDL